MEESQDHYENVFLRRLISQDALVRECLRVCFPPNSKGKNTLWLQAKDISSKYQGEKSPFDYKPKIITIWKQQQLQLAITRSWSEREWWHGRPGIREALSILKRRDNGERAEAACNVREHNRENLWTKRATKTRFKVQASYDSREWPGDNSKRLCADFWPKGIWKGGGRDMFMM